MSFNLIINVQLKLLNDEIGANSFLDKIRRIDKDHLPPLVLVK